MQYELAGRTREVIKLLEEFESELLKGKPFTSGDALLALQAKTALDKVIQKLQS
jgi:hypothetical protein